MQKNFSESKIFESCASLFHTKYCIQNFILQKILKVLLQQVRIYETNICPSVLSMIGYTIRKGKLYLYVENKGNGTLEDLINDFNYIKLNQTNKLIIAYGVECALESLHKNNHQIFHLILIFIFFLSNFNYAIQIYTKIPYFLTLYNVIYRITFM